MPNFELSTEEKQTLIEVLEDNISDLRMEIADTDSSIFKEEIRTRKKILIDILERLKEN